MIHVPFLKNKSIFSRKLLLVGCILLILFTLFSSQVAHGGYKQLDFAATVKLQDEIDKSTHLRMKNLVGEVMEGSTFFASPEFSVVWVLVLAGVAVYDWKQKKIRWKGFVIPILFGLLILAEMYGKSVVHHPAPPFFMIKNPITIFPKYYINEQFSYPSGHAARAIFLALCTYALCIMHYAFWKKTSRKKLLAIVLFCYVGLVVISRVYLGHHWLSDIIGGLLLGIGCALISIGVLKPSLERIESKG